MIEALLDELGQQQVKLWREGDELCVAAPPDTLTRQHRELLRELKPQILEFLGRSQPPPEASELAELPTLVSDPAHRFTPFPLTEIQHAYWVGRNAGPELGNVATHVYFEVATEGIDLGRLEGAWQQLIERHDMLRAVVDRDGQQRVLEDPPLYHFEASDLRGVVNPRGELEALQERMSHQIRPAHQWPLFEICASRLDQHRVIVHISIDFLIVDLWSMFLLFKEWRDLYHDPTHRLPDLEITFRDYVLAEQELDTTPRYARARDYWLERLPNLPPGPDLPLARNPAAIEAPRFVRRSQKLGAASWQILKQRAHQAGLTPSCLLLAAFAETLAHWSRSERFTLTLTLFQRLPFHEQVNSIVGDFTSTLLLAIDAASEPTFLQRAAGYQDQLFRDLEHRSFSGLAVLREQARRQKQRAGLTAPVVFTSALALDGVGGEALALDAFGEVRDSITQTPQVWLDHQIVEQDGGLNFNWDVVEELFPEGMIDDMFASYVGWLEELAAGSAWEERRKRTPEHQLRTRREANDTAVALREGLLHSLLEGQVAERSAQLAIIAVDRELTFGELDAEANALAQWLIRSGVQPGALVAISLPKGWRQVVATLAVLKAGAAYVPIEPELPLQRRLLLLGEAGVLHLVSSTDASRDLVEQWSGELIHFEGPPALGEPGSPRVPQDPGALAYVIYTSGSTGVPKGVMMSHRAALNTVEDMNRRFGIGAEDRVLALSSLSFDLSVYDIFGVLGAGGTLIQPSAQGLRDPSHWRALARQHGATVWNSVPALLQMCLDSAEGLDEHPAPELRRIFLSGDWISPELAGRALDLWPDSEVISLGGATEAAIWSIYHRIGELAADWHSIPYGKPLANQSFHVLNEAFEAVPDWVPGMLYIAGAGLAEGYWGDEQKSALAFITHPDSGERLYRTGDLGRYRPGGVIEILGREDHQVKLRGHRIELGEIEAALQRHEGVRDCAVDLAREAQGGGQLLAYIVAHEDRETELLAAQQVDEEVSKARWKALAAAPPIQPAWSAKPDDIRRSWGELDALYLQAVAEAFTSLGLFSSSSQPLDVESIFAQAQIAPRYRRWVARALAILVEQGWLERLEGGQLASAGLPQGDLGTLRGTVRDSFGTVLGWDEDDLDWVLKPAESLVDLLTETVHSAELYTEEQTPRLYAKLYGDCHRRMAGLVAVLAESQPSRPLRALEVGAGLGTVTEHLLPRLARTGVEYIFTDISRFFFPAAREKFRAWPFVRYELLDLDEDPSLQGFVTGSYDLIVAASVLHDVKQVRTSLPWLRSLLAPGGVLLILEETQFRPAFDLGMGLQQGFDSFEDLDLRSSHPLLSSEQWLDELARAGFEGQLRVEQVEGTLATELGFEIFLAAAPRTVHQLQVASLEEHLGALLPRYMVPSDWILLPELPRSANGKLDRGALPRPQAAASRPIEASRELSPTETRLASIWSHTLEVTSVQPDDDFFALGGDSLLATRLITKVRQEFGVELGMRSLFAATTLARLAAQIDKARIEGLTPADESMLLPLVENPAARYQPFPLTDVQQAYWVGRTDAFALGQIATSAYFEIDGEELHLDRLQGAIRLLIDRHEMLRAVVLSDGTQQILETVPPLDLEVIPLADLDAEQVEEKLSTLRQEMPHELTPAHLWPLFDFRVSLLPEGRFRLHLRFDALIADAWSVLCFLGELGALYRRPEMHLQPVELSFRDYLSSVGNLTGTEVYQNSRKYWMSRLDTLPPAPELPLAVQPQSLGQPRFRRHGGRLEPDTWSTLRARAKRLGVTPSCMLLAAFSQILATWSKSPRFTVNLTLFSRLPLHPQVYDLLGDFTTLNLLEVDASQASFSELAVAVQKQLWRDMDHRFMNGVAVLRELSRRRGLESAAMPVVFTSALVLGSFGRNASVLDGLGQFSYGFSQTPQVWLDHQVIEHNGALVFNWDVVEGLFPDGFVETLFSTYNQLLSSLAGREESWWQQRCWVPEAQLELRAGINMSRGVEGAEILPGGFLERLREQPQHPAVISDERTLTYGELAREAFSVARVLRQAGAPTDLPVAILLAKGWQQVVAVLAVHLAGAPYLPVDPELPEPRKSLLMMQAGVRLAITLQPAALEPWWPTEIQRLPLQEVRPISRSEVDEAWLPTPEDLAYVIYTSGSTGLPKGVMTDHRGASNTLRDINHRFAVEASDRVLALSSLSFDLSVYDVFGTLAAGAAIVMPMAGRERDPEHWLDLMERHGVTIWNSVPVLMQMVVEDLVGRGQRAPRALRLALLSGDWIPVQLPSRMKALWPELEMISLGGATEASIWSIFHRIEEVDSGRRSIPYGKPLTQQSVQVLDAQLRPCPDWVPGELYIGGKGLALGYLGDEAKTRAAFPIDPESGERLYRTGDWGRYLPGGDIELLGREDTQVKVQGYRIELGEIEACLERHPDVREAVVVIRGTESKRLVAFVTPTEGGSVGPVSASTGLAFAGDPAVGESAPGETAAESAQASSSPGDAVDESVAISDPLRRLEAKLAYQAQRQPPEASNGIYRFASLAPLASEDSSFYRRRSFRHFSSEPLATRTLSSLLDCLRQEEVDGFARAQYASAGGLYPVQAWVFVKPGSFEDLDGGFYYYHPTEHSLIQASADKGLELEALHSENHLLWERASFALLLVAELAAIEPMYGRLSRDFCLLEAGYMGQLLMTRAAHHRLGLCPIGEISSSAVGAALALGDRRLLLHGFAGGPIRQEWIEEPESYPPVGLGAASLQGWLKKQLPAYMMPTSFTVLDALPLSRNGKVDRGVLSNGVEPRRVSRREDRQPRSDHEQLVAQIVREILSIEEVGTTENFFELGASSVHLIRLRARLEESLGGTISVVEMFRNPTVRFLAESLFGETETLGVEQIVEQAQQRSEKQQMNRQARAQARRRGRQRPVEDAANTAEG